MPHPSPRPTSAVAASLADRLRAAPLTRPMLLARFTRAAPSAQLGAAPAPNVPPEQLLDAIRFFKSVEVEPELLTKARKLVHDVEQRLMALARAGAERFNPSQNVLSVDEDSRPVFSDEEYTEYLLLVEDLTQILTLRAVGDFLGLPLPLLDRAAEERLRLLAAPRRNKPRPMVRYMQNGRVVG